MLWPMAALWPLLATTIVVTDDAHCLDPAAIAKAVDEVGGINEVVERIEVRVACTEGAACALPHEDDEAVLSIRLLLVGGDVARTTRIRPHECADVPDLVAVLLATHRRVAEATTQAPAPPMPRADRRRPQPTPTETWSACDGPPPCTPLGIPAFVSVGVGPTLEGGRSQLDAGWGLHQHLRLETVAAAFVGVSSSGSSALGLEWGVGAAFPTTLSLLSKGLNLELSLRPSLAIGIVPNMEDALPVHLAPRLAARVRWGFVFVELGTIARIGQPLWVDAYLLLGLTPIN